MSDLIDRQKVLNTLDNMDKALDEDRTVENYKELLTDCIKVLPTSENKGDLISRQAVENITWEEPSYSDPLNVLTEVREKVRALPSVENRGEWIPVSERLPKDEEDVLVYCEYGGMKIAYYHHDYTRYSIGFKDLNETGWYDENDDAMYPEPIAWMPLPEPYKKGGE